MNARTVLTAAVIFALAMTALNRGGWWWAWFGLALWTLTGMRLPPLRLPTVGWMQLALIRRHYRKTRRRERQKIREERRKQRQLQRMRRRE